MPDVTYFNYSASAQAWPAAFAWINPTVMNGGTELRVTNSDGTITVFFGTGLHVDTGTGAPDTGTVTNIKRATSAGWTNITLEEYTISGPAFPDLASFYQNGLSTWFLAGNDLINGTAATETLQGGDGNDILFDGGGAGTDTLVGGKGNDTYLVQSSATVIIEKAGDGALDEVDIEAAAFTMPAEVELAFAAYKGVKITGNALSNTIFGSDGKDELIGLAGDDALRHSYSGAASDGSADKLSGGLGNDTYFVGDTTDIIVEAANQGHDKVISSALVYTLSANVEDLEFDTFPTVKAVTFTGNTLANTISGSGIAGDKLLGLAGDDTLVGNGGDTLIGGLGNDTYVVTDATDTITEKTGEGTDTVKTDFDNFSLANHANVENFIYTGFVTSTVVGNDLDNTFDVRSTTNGANLSGGKGNDTYIIAEGPISVFENVGEGVADLVQSLRQSYVLSANVENATIAGGVSGQSRQLVGNTLVNKLTGDISDDKLDGGQDVNTPFLNDLAADVLKGGKGNDSYLVRDWDAKAKDVVTELANEGIDTVYVQPGISAYTLPANVENLALYLLTLGGAWTGNALDNVMTGSLNAVKGKDTLYGLAGNDTLWGQGDVDTLHGGQGDDTYVIMSGMDDDDVIVEKAGEGTDTVETDITYSIATLVNVENIKAKGTNDSQLVGNDAANVLTGNVGLNDIQGGKGDDTLSGGVDNMADALAGGEGNDTYVIDEVDDLASITDANGAGTDIIRTKLATVTIPDATGSTYIENLTYVGSSAFKGTGNGLKNVITSATGLVLADTLDGGAGDDTLIAGKGDDTYIVDSAADKIVEAAKEGTDTIKTALVSYTLGANAKNVEILSFTGAGAFTGTGDGAANTIIGGAQADTLKGLGGDDTLDGGAGGDTLEGGAGNDTYIVDSTSDIVTELASGGTDTIKTALTVFDLSDPSKPGRLQVENLTYTGVLTATLTGNALANVIKGGTNGNTIHGKAGDDQLFGGTDPDSLYGDEGNDKLYGMGGGGQIFGGIGDDLLDGGGDGTTMDGGDGNDTYVVRDWFETITEGASATSGIDKVEFWVVDPALWVMADNVESLAFKAASGGMNVKGNASGNAITGGAGNDKIDGAGGNDALIGGDGDDALDGGAGKDAMTGGKGDDTYLVDDIGDKVTEAAAQGTDTVRTTLLTYTLGANVENLVLEGLGFGTGIGNALANTITGTNFADVLKGLAGNDVLDGGGNVDTLEGGLGDDTYLVDSFADTVTELVGQGTDTMKTSVSRDLAANVENITYVGAGATFFSSGNELANVMTGGASAKNTLLGEGGDDTLIGGKDSDSLSGGLGNDTMKGGEGADWFEAGSGNDTLWGGSGIDLFYFDPAENNGGIVNRDLGTNTIWDFQAAKYGDGDLIVILNTSVTDFAGIQNHMTQQTDGVLVSIVDPGQKVSILLKGLALADLTSADFQFT